MSWLTGYRRLNHRYERHPRNYLAFLGLAAALCCYKRLARLTTRTGLIAAIRRLRWPWLALDGWGLGQSEGLFDCGPSRWLGTVQGIMRV